MQQSHSDRTCLIQENSNENGINELLEEFNEMEDDDFEDDQDDVYAVED